MTLFFRILEADVEEKAEALKGAVRGLGGIFEVAPSTFGQVPGSPFAYWLSERVRGAFASHPPFVRRFEAWVGLQTNDDFRWLRLMWEQGGDPGSPTRLVPLAKGGRFSPFYADLTLGVRWGESGSWIKNWKLDQLRMGRITANNSKCWNESHYLRPGLTWPSRTNGLSFRVLPGGCIFGHKGPTAFVDGNSHTALLALCALMNSRCFGYLVSAQLARTELAQSYEVGLIQQTPVPELSASDVELFAQRARRAWSLNRSLDTTKETSHAFLLPPGLNEKVGGLDRGAIARELTAIQEEIDEAAFTLYGIGPQDRAAIDASAKRPTSSDHIIEDGFDDEEDDAIEDDVLDDAGQDALTSWLVGVAFGRFDARLSTGERAIPPEPDPFDPLPSRSPGMWPEGDPQTRQPDILVDDEGHPEDLVAHVRAVAESIHVATPENLRSWLAKEFFPLHIRMYSKSRRKAPIYWQLATPSASYSAWLYIHAFSKDTLFRVQNDYAAPKLAHEERRLESLTKELRDKATTAQRKELAAQEGLVEELRTFVDEVKRAAPLWKPNLDDGVIINFAPLWRLVPQNKSWQKELKSTWDALCDGKYDWAHLAMHLWPERVVPKCAMDRSIAIAHGLEEVFWLEGADGKWSARKAPTRSIDELVKEWTSPAVKAALKSLLEAPVASGKSTGRKGGGRRKTSAAAAEGGDA